MTTLQPSDPANGGWALQITGQDANDTGTHDDFKSVCVIPGAGTTPSGDTWREDQVYTVVERVIDGNTVTTIELFTPVDWGEPNYAWFVDCGGKGMGYQPGQAEIILPEVVGDYTEFFCGVLWSAGSGQNIVFNIKTDNTLDTTWGTDGAWSFSNAWGGTSRCDDIIQLDDNRMLVLHNTFWVDEDTLVEGGKIAACTMLTETGAIDTTWGHNGHYIISETGAEYPYATFGSKLLHDKNGNFHLFAWANFGSRFNYHIFDADGTRLYAYSWSVQPHAMVFYDATLSPDGDRIIAAGIDSQTGGQTYNLMAFNIADGTRDTTWTGNLGVPGCTYVATQSAKDAYCIEGVSDGYIVGFQYGGTDYRTLVKIDLDGVVDTSWGTNGYVEAGDLIYNNASLSIDDDGNIWTLGRKRLTGNIDTTDSVIHCFSGTDGSTLNQTIIQAAATDVYHALTTIDANVYLGTTDVSPAVERVEQWTNGMVYTAGISAAAYTRNNILIRDETSREYDPGGTIPAVPEAWVEGPGTQLDGASVCVYADAIPRGTFTMDGNDILDFTEADYDVIIAGLNYWSKLETMPLIVSPDPNTIIADKKLMALRLDLQDAYGFNYAMGSEATPVECSFGEIISSVVTLSRVTWPFGSQKKACIYIEVWDPTPLGIRALVPEIVFYRP